jgi:hypothetical protein
MFKAAALLFLSSIVIAESSLRGSDDVHRELLSRTTIVGKCTAENFMSVLGSATVSSYLKTNNNSADIGMAIYTKCEAALTSTADLVDTVGKGPQFLKNFLDGGTTWNDNYEDAYGNYALATDTAFIDAIYDKKAKSTVFSSPDGGTSPRYFSNFYMGELECPLGVIQCCYTGSRSATNPFNGNADVCAFDLGMASKSNHINRAEAFTFYDMEKSSNQAYCSGFAYESGSFDDDVKYNTLFHMAIKTNLHENGLVKNIPGAPLCGCASQMPIVDNVDCVKPIEGYTLDSDGNVSLNMSWESCGTDLASYYNTLNREEEEKNILHSRIVTPGECSAAAKDFMNDRMFVRAST